MRIRGDRDDVFSQGFICPKGSTLKQLHEDPDRLRRPVVKRDGALRGGRAGTRRSPRSSGGSSRCSTSTAATPAAVYIGNPNAHNLAGMLYNRPVLRALGTTNLFSASHGRPAAEGDLRRR